MLSDLMLECFNYFYEKISHGTTTDELKYMKERVEEVYTTEDNDQSSLITGIFVSCRKIARSKTPAKDNHDRY